jgi:peptidoglycan/xylan/chitin deacetylase (PgdA/CDA1 family)
VLKLKILMLVATVFFMLAAYTRTCRADDPVINVLCYHRFQETGGKSKDSYWINQERFESHLLYLKENGYNVVPMKRYVDFIEGREKDMPEKSVIITIDDGYQSVYEYAYPLLKKYGYSAVVYLYSVFFPGGKNALSTEDVKIMMADGFEFGSHSYTHPYLTQRKNHPDDQEYLKMLRHEIIDSKKYLEKKTGVKVETLAYPYGLYSGVITEIIKEAGYKAAFSVVPSYNTADTDRYMLKRTMLYSSDKAEKLIKILEKKPLKLSEMSPADGEIIAETPLKVTAMLVEDSLLNTATIKFKMGNVELKDSVYDPAIRTVVYEYTTKPLGKGVHVASVVADGKNGGRYEYSWMFVIGPVVARELLDGK